jgi:hypothetical protein
LLIKPCWHIGEKSCPLIHVNTQKNLKQRKKTHLLSADPDKDFPLLEPPLSWSSCEMKQLLITKSAQVGSMMIKSGKM